MRDVRMDYTGTVKFYKPERGFGFIIPEKGGDDIFVHVSSIASGSPELREGQRVQYQIGPGRKPGKNSAINVRILS